MFTSKNKTWSAVGLIFIGIVVGIIVTAKLNWTPKSFATKTNPPATLVAAPETSGEPVMQLQNTGKAFTQVSKEILPTVVSISTSKLIRRSNQDNEGWGPILMSISPSPGKVSGPNPMSRQWIPCWAPGKPSWWWTMCPNSGKLPWACLKDSGIIP